MRKLNLRVRLYASSRRSQGASRTVRFPSDAPSVLLLSASRSWKRLWWSSL